MPDWKVVKGASSTPKKRTDSALARALGTGFVIACIAAMLVISVLACVAVVVGLWKFIGWALG